MLKLNASYSKKVPSDAKFSSESYLACIEVELPSGATGAELQQKIHDTFNLVKQSVESELKGRTSGDMPARQQQPQGRSQAPASTPSTPTTASVGS